MAEELFVDQIRKQIFLDIKGTFAFHLPNDVVKVSGGKTLSDKSALLSNKRKLIHVIAKEMILGKSQDCPNSTFVVKKKLINPALKGNHSLK